LASGIASFLVSLLALAIVLYTALVLQDADITVPTDIDQVVNGTFITEQGCLLGDSEEWANSNCLWLEILGGITIGIGLLIALVQCCTCNLCGLGAVLDLAFAVAGAIAWGITAGLLMDDIDAANAADPANEDERLVILIMMWAEFGLFCIILVGFITRCCASNRYDK
jgi:Na+-translocating ferredoxin:NAD+ oxidoreductase RnfE subunit